MPREFFSWL
ncbi:unnamed protein product [Acanthoscelides obtectus]|uniref:Uncharacterized protein n=1 Tax=Acanthoscelides obtectus TaxID=200917 RepID=A0A9P0JQM8_ACAOB|nr:unnamed protein product [Acanthoscelides obtectus]CAK1634661.1 hypothetical protein AOBTE_LOCUS8856 [Acanthoscelides obtectus]